MRPHSLLHLCWHLCRHAGRADMALLHLTSKAETGTTRIQKYLGAVCGPATKTTSMYSHLRLERPWRWPSGAQASVMRSQMQGKQRLTHPRFMLSSQSQVCNCPPHKTPSHSFLPLLQPLIATPLIAILCIRFLVRGRPHLAPSKAVSSAPRPAPHCIHRVNRALLRRYQHA